MPSVYHIGGFGEFGENRFKTRQSQLVQSASSLVHELSVSVSVCL